MDKHDLHNHYLEVWISSPVVLSETCVIKFLLEALMEHVLTVCDVFGCESQTCKMHLFIFVEDNLATKCVRNTEQMLTSSLEQQLLGRIRSLIFCSYVEIMTSHHIIM